MQVCSASGYTSLILCAAFIIVKESGSLPTIFDKIQCDILHDLRSWSRCYTLPTTFLSQTRSKHFWGISPRHAFPTKWKGTIFGRISLLFSSPLWSICPSSQGSGDDSFLLWVCWWFFARVPVPLLLCGWNVNGWYSNARSHCNLKEKLIEFQVQVIYPGCTLLMTWFFQTHETTRASQWRGTDKRSLSLLA